MTDYEKSLSANRRILARLKKIGFFEPDDYGTYTYYRLMHDISFVLSFEKENYFARWKIVSYGNNYDRNTISEFAKFSEAFEKMTPLDKKHFLWHLDLFTWLSDNPTGTVDEIWEKTQYLEDWEE